ncbi:hypothetical protein EG830_11495 [bacterium]|nr:hypothetical protein [bacterium]
MSILVYSNSDDQSLSDQLFKFITTMVPNSRVDFLQTMHALRERVQQLSKEIDVAILVAKDSEQLCELVSLKDFLEGVRIILILPDQKKETVSRATRLFPSFISTLDSGLDTVGEVLKKMIKVRDAKILEEMG